MKFGDVSPENREGLDSGLDGLPEEPSDTMDVGVPATDRADGLPDINDDQLPLDCINTSSESLGTACEHCSRGDDCPALAAGRTIVSQQARIAELTEQANEFEQKNVRLLERILGLQTDTLIGTAFTPEGLKDYMEHNPELIEELREKRWGVVRLDGRFVKYMNRFGNLVGDRFLEAGGSQITAIADGLVRVGERRTDPSGPPGAERRSSERRAGHALTQDIICRQGGDEFALLIRGTDPRNLAIIAARIQSKLTVFTAVDRYAQGGIPFIASVGFAHARDLGPEVTAALAHNNPWLAFSQIAGRADEGQQTTKTRQYQEMWSMVLAATPIEERPATIAQPDDSVVAEQFLRRMCPRFSEDPVSFLRHQG